MSATKSCLMNKLHQKFSGTNYPACLGETSQLQLFTFFSYTYNYTGNITHNGTMEDFTLEEEEHGAEGVEEEVVEEGEMYTIVIGTSLRNSHLYYTVYVVYMNLVLNGIAPLLTLVILNSLVYHRLRWDKAVGFTIFDVMIS